MTTKEMVETWLNELKEKLRTSQLKVAEWRTKIDEEQVQILAMKTQIDEIQNSLKKL